MLERLLILERTGDLFVTVCDITIAPDRAAMRYRLAGHPAPLVLRGRDVTELDDSRRGLPLGITAGDGWLDHDVALSADWAVLMFTDGLFEGRTGAGSARLGVDGLIEMLGDLLPIDETGDQMDRLLELVEAAHGGPLDDDVAVLQLRSRTAP
jgi:serine phosphatase RsbU (regulator of sigma subunit)